jgi:hypothetical protein
MTSVWCSSTAVSPAGPTARARRKTPRVVLTTLCGVGADLISWTARETGTDLETLGHTTPPGAIKATTTAELAAIAGHRQPTDQTE